jgi:hypothetical protein
MTAPEHSPDPPAPSEPPLQAGDHRLAEDPLALDPLSPIAAPDRRWFRPAHERA